VNIMSASRFWKTSVLLVCLIPTMLLAACTRRSAAIDQAGDTRLNWEIQPFPARTGEASIDIYLTDTSGAPVQGAQLSFRGDMTHAGMTPVITGLQETEPGVYRGEIEWTMAGAWVLTIQGELEDGRTLKRQIDLEVSP
jgi:hypothetical protein